MKKILFLLFILIFASSARATVYKWVDEGGVVNFADDDSKIPPDYRNRVEELNLAQMGPSQAPPGKTAVSGQSDKIARQAPPINQPLIREGDFAIKLAEALKIGRAKSEAEAESMLASVGIAPKNGWIADYPVTPDVVGELEKTVGEAADGKRLQVGRNEALKVLRTTAVELELPIIAEVQDDYAESPAPTTPEYTAPNVINNYYYAEGPPVVTYYPPPWDYYYMYAWIPSPFWYSDFYFPGFFILNDFHRVIIFHKHRCVVTNHFRDHRTGRILAVDPVRRHAGGIIGDNRISHGRGFNSADARNGARAIFERSRQQVDSGKASRAITGRGLNDRNSAYSRSGRGTEKQGYNQGYNRESNPSRFDGRNNNYGRPPVTDRGMQRNPGATGFQGMGDGSFSRPDSMNRQNRMNYQRPSTGESRSFSPPSQGTERSFSPQPQGGGQHFGSSPSRSGGFSESPKGGDRGGGFERGGPRF